MSFKNKNYTISRQSDASEDEDYWLKNLSATLEKEAVQPRRVDQNLFERINSIMNNKSKYTSVEAAVEDMKARSGLTAYLDKVKISKDTDACNRVKKATENYETESEENISPEKTDAQNKLIEEIKKAYTLKNWKLMGELSGKLEKIGGNPRINAVEFIRVIKYFNDKELSAVKIPVDNWKEFTIGYGKGYGSSEDEIKSDLKFTDELVKLIKNKGKDTNQAIDKKIDLTPAIFEKNPNIKNTIDNYVRDTRGNLPVPAILDKIKSIHRSDVSEDSDWDDDKLLTFISNLNLEAKKSNPRTQNYNNLGTRDQTNDNDIDAANVDAFHGLNPVKF